MRRPGRAGAAAAGLAAAAALGFGATAAGCGPSARDLARREAQDFNCRDRSVRYAATQHIAGDEIGVQMDCAEAGPRIMRWKTDKGGGRVDDKRSMSPAEFDRVWKDIAGTGWENLKDCTTGTLGKEDPVYAFEVRDDQNQASFKCQSLTMPFPYNGIVDPLDLAAQRGGGQLGDDEPAALKELEQRQKQEKRGK